MKNQSRIKWNNFEKNVSENNCMSDMTIHTQVQQFNVRELFVIASCLLNYDIKTHCLVTALF